jgi:hypothetical protein
MAQVVEVNFGQDQVLSEYILLPTAKLVAPRSVRAGDSFVRVSA